MKNGVRTIEVEIKKNLKEIVDNERSADEVEKDLVLRFNRDKSKSVKS